MNRLSISDSRLPYLPKSPTRRAAKAAKTNRSCALRQDLPWGPIRLETAGMDSMDDSLSFASHTPWVATVATPLPASLHSDAAHFVVPRSHEQQKTAKGGPAVHQFLGLKLSHTLELSIHILRLALPQTCARNCGKTIPSSGLTGFQKWTGYLAASVPRILATQETLEDSILTSKVEIKCYVLPGHGTTK